MNFVLPIVILICPRPTSGTLSPVTVLIEFPTGLIFSIGIFNDSKRVELTIVMLLPVSIVARQGTFSTNASNKSPWKISFSSRPLFLSFEVLSFITGSRPLIDPANARFPDYLCFDHVYRIQTDCSSRRDSPDYDHGDSVLSRRSDS